MTDWIDFIGHKETDTVMKENRNVVFMIELNQGQNLNYSEWCYKSWAVWCRRNDVRLVRLRKEITDPAFIQATWQRYWMFRLLEKSGHRFDQVAMVDIDTMIKPDCPNFFLETNGKMGVVLDGCSVNWMQNAINGYKSFFPDVKLHWWEFFFAGYVVVNHRHAGFFDQITTFYLENILSLKDAEIRLKKGTDITVVNYLAKKYAIELEVLCQRYQLASLAQKNILEKNKFFDLADVWHFNGFAKEQRDKYMKATWGLIEKRYPGVAEEAGRFCIEDVEQTDVLSEREKDAISRAYAVHQEQQNTSRDKSARSASKSPPHSFRRFLASILLRLGKRLEV